ncbi:hypothetical protein KKH23_09830, partial [Patescibacteria group bacterium]|nr:hypothetical protein [Patescibacteria group bacterium]
MDTRLVSGSEPWFYAPYLYGADDDIFKVFTGTAKALNGKIRIRATVDGTAAKVSTTTMIMMGENTLDMTIPTAPTSGDSRIFGFYSMNYGNRNAAYFYISGTNFYARTYSDSSATAESTTITWNTSWTNTPIKYEIRWYINRIEFWVDGVQKALHSFRFPAQVLLPLYFYNNKYDGMYLNYIEVKDARKMYFAKPYGYS